MEAASSRGSSRNEAAAAGPTVGAAAAARAPSGAGIRCGSGAPRAVRTSSAMTRTRTVTPDEAAPLEPTAASETYLSACSDRTVKPNGQMVRVLCGPDVSSIVVLQLQDNYLGDSGVACIASVMNQVLPALRGVGFAKNGIANAGVEALCKALCEKSCSVQALDLRENALITRVGGQVLLNTAGRCDRLAFLDLEETRVTDYFEKRITKHIHRHFEMLSEEGQREVSDLVNVLQGLDEVEDDDDVDDGVNIVLREDDDTEVVQGDAVRSVRISASPNGSPTQGNRVGSEDITRVGTVCSNAPFDEIYYVVDDDGDEIPGPMIDETRENNSAPGSRAVSRPDAPSVLETILYSTTPDFLAVIGSATQPTAESALKYAITNMPERERTVYAMTTPTPYDIFAYVEAYTPKDIEIPTKFIFPGRIDYTAAVHAPDAIIAPPMPHALVGNPGTASSSRAPTPTDVPPTPVVDAPTPAIPDDSNEGSSTAPDATAAAEGEAEGAGTVAATGSSDQKSMYWNFFNTASKQTPTTSGCTTPRETQLASQQMLRSRDPTPDAEPESTSGSREREDAKSLSSQPSSTTNPVATAIPAAIAAQPYDVTVVPTFIASSPSHLSSRPVRTKDSKITNLHEKSLCELLLDPRWVPNRPTRTEQMSLYCNQNHLSYNNVTADRMKIEAEAKAPREFFLERLIRPSLVDKLTAGTMDPSGRYLATSSYDMTCKVWDLETGKKLRTLRGHEGHLSDCLWNGPARTKLVTASFDKTVRVWDANTGQCLHTLVGHELEVVCICMAPDGLQCVSGGMDDIAIVWDIENGVEVCSLVGHEGEIVTVDWSPVGKVIATGSMDETVRLWDSETGESLRVLEGHTAEVGQVRFNCYGNMVLSCSPDSTCRLWDVHTGNSKVLRGHTHEVVDIDFSADGWTCASASDDGTARIWDVLTGGCLSMLVGHSKGVCRVAFNKDGTELYTGSVDATAKVWNIASSTCTQTLRGHKSVVLVFYNSQSERILTLSKDNTCRIWKLEPDSDSLFHRVALSICQRPTLFSDLSSPSEPGGTAPMPPRIQQAVERIYRKLHRSDRESLSAPTPLPQMKTPDPDDSIAESSPVPMTPEL